MNKPPVIVPPRRREPKSIRLAATLNLIVPGAGQFYLGQRVFGLLLAVAFVGCVVAALSLFLIGYAHYLGVALDPLKGQQLEGLRDVFHKYWLIGLLLVAVIIWVISLAALSRAPAGGAMKNETGGQPPASKS